MNLYFNNAFSKQPLEQVLEVMAPFFRKWYENPLTESEGAEVTRTAILNARERVAELLHAQPSEIYFVSSGTEANNWAVKGPLAAVRQERPRHVVISAIEHFSVYQSALFLRKQGVEVTVVPVNAEGLVDIDRLAGAITPETSLVSINAGSDEIGVMQDLSGIVSLKSRFPEVLFHTDAIQYVVYEELDVAVLPFDLVSISSNALYGPPGIAALYVRSGTRIVPLLHGGMQEEGMRPGSQNPALIAGFGEAARLSAVHRISRKEKVKQWQNLVFRALEKAGARATGSRAQRLVDNVHTVVDVDGEALLALLQDSGIQGTTGSTCSQYAQKESHVLAALGLTAEAARGAVLFTGSIYNTTADGVYLGERFAECLRGLRQLKPDITS